MLILLYCSATSLSVEWSGLGREREGEGKGGRAPSEVIFPPSRNAANKWPLIGSRAYGGELKRCNMCQPPTNCYTFHTTTAFPSLQMRLHLSSPQSQAGQEETAAVKIIDFCPDPFKHNTILNSRVSCSVTQSVPFQKDSSGLQGCLVPTILDPSLTPLPTRREQA